jgi:hypothetical protein
MSSLAPESVFVLPEQATNSAVDRKTQSAWRE